MSEPTRTDPACQSPYERRGPLVNLVWLCYSVFFFVDAAQHGTWQAWLTSVLLFSVFLVLYLGVAIGSGSRRTKRLLMAALTLFGLGAYWVNTGAGVVFIYVAAFAAAGTDSAFIGGLIITGAAALAAGEGWALHYSVWNWGIFAFFTVPAGISGLFWSLRARANARLTLAQEQIEHLAQVAERERIARDLHDVLGHTLSVVVLKSELAGKLIGADAQRARCEIGEVEQIARKALGEVREAIRGYRTDGIAAEIARARRALDAAGVSLQWQPQSLRLEPAHEPVLSLVLREAVTNILRHARATSCRLELTADGHGTRLTIEDDGQGASEYSGNGVRGMRERVEALGGQLRIDCNRGTRLTAEIPAPVAS